jgi:gp16 family phage-associated protein
MAKLRSKEEVRAEFERRGLSIRSWARANGIDAATVYNLLSGRKAVGRRGEAHKAAVLLGLKDGVVVHEGQLQTTATPLFPQSQAVR